MQHTAKALDKRVPFPFANDTPLQDVLRYVQAATEDDEGKLEFVVDEQELQKAEVTMQSPVVLNLNDATLGTSLTLLLDQLGLTYTVNANGAIVVRAARN